MPAVMIGDGPGGCGGQRASYISRSVEYAGYGGNPAEAGEMLGTRLISIRLIPYMLPVIKVIMVTLNVGAVL